MAKIFYKYQASKCCGLREFREFFDSKKRKKRKIIILTACIILLVFGIIFTLGGATLLAYYAGTDADGYSQSNVYEVRSSAHAFALWVGPAIYPSYLDWMSPKDIGQAMWTVKPTESSKELFVGWAEAADGQNYLNGFTFETPPVWHWYVEAFYAEIEIPTSLVHNQGAPTRPPAEETFWLKTAKASDTYKLIWDAFWKPTTDRKILIIMNYDGSSNIEADLQLGFTAPILTWLPFVLIPSGVIFCISAIFVIRRKKLFKLLKIGKKENSNQ